MSKIYIANTKPHKEQFNYRLPKEWNENGRVVAWFDTKFEEIPPGGQICLASGRNFNERECEALLAHHALYGMIRVGEYKKGFRGLIFNLDKPVQLDRIQEAIEANGRAAEERSETMLQRTAAANLDHQRQFARDAGMQPPDRSELEIVEEPKAGDPAIAKGVEALADGAAPRRGRAAA